MTPITLHPVGYVRSSVSSQPYYPVYDRVEEAVVPDWVPRLMRDYF